MADEGAATPDSQPGANAVPAEHEAGIGQRLRHSREARELTAEAAAASLHMDPSTLLALEGEEFSRLGAPVFVRGHLRRYATLLGLDVDDMLATYERNSPPEPMPTRPLQSRERFAVDDGLNWPVVVGVVVVFLLVVLAVWRLWDQPGEPVPMSTEALQNAMGESVPDESSPLEDAVVLPVPVPVLTALGPREPDTRGEVLADAAGPGSSALSAGSGETLEIVVSLDDECWTEITDATGRRLYFGMGQATQRIAVRGAAPISVLLGNAGAARMEVDGRTWPLSDGDVSGNVARLRIEGLP